MKRSIFKPILFGILFGETAFFVPFLLVKILFFGLILSLIFRLFWWRSGGMQHRMAFIDKVRSMDDEEYAAFKNKFSSSHCCHHSHCCHSTPKHENKA